MTTFTIKLVDHRESTDTEKHSIQASIEKKFGVAFKGTSDGVSVSWAPGVESDNLVVHFVEDPGHSYIINTWPDMDTPDPEAGGHTHSHGSKSGSEVYRLDAKGERFRLSAYGALVFHEALHNLFPFRNDVHTGMGGGLALAVVPHGIDPNDANIKWIRQGFSVKNPQLL